MYGNYRPVLLPEDAMFIEYLTPQLEVHLVQRHQQRHGGISGRRAPTACMPAPKLECLSQLIYVERGSQNEIL